MSNMLAPFEAFDALFNRLGTFGSWLPREVGDAETILRPRVDIYENESEYIIEADLPGVRKGDLKVEVEKNRLTISATRTKEERKHEAIHMERHTTASFVRSFTLGNDVDAEGIRATFKDGVLKLQIPKVEQAVPRRIEVK